METWDDLYYWKTSDWSAVQEKLASPMYNVYCPSPTYPMFRALEATSFKNTRVAWIGQDPYPTPGMATGLAFSIPSSVEPHKFPSSLKTIFKEYRKDLGLEYPTCGSLESWVEQGVLLWNSIPTCNIYAPLSHDWDEWRSLTKEIVCKLDEKEIVFVLMGAKAKRFAEYVKKSKVICTSHPSPRGQLNTKIPLVGSRLFSTINHHLGEQGLGSINWSLS
jgi:uracil-DNA glycosylase